MCAVTPSGTSLRRFISLRSFAYANAIILALLSLGVLIARHHPQFPANTVDSTFMTYTSAVGFCACALGIFAAARQHRPLGILSELIIFLIVLLNALYLLTKVQLGTATWVAESLNKTLSGHQLMPPTACLAFLFAGIAVHLGFKTQGPKAVAACFLCIVILFITLTAWLSQGFNGLPSFIWLGIEMAPQTAAGFAVFAIGLISLRITAAIDAFNRFNVFSRLATGFVAMSLLFIGIGSIGSLQVNNVVGITQELYEKPVQVNNSALRIKNQVAMANRHLKDIAVDAALASSFDIPANMRDVEREILQELTLLREKSDAKEIAALAEKFDAWRAAILVNHSHLTDGDIETYREKTLTEIQELTITLEQICETISQQAQRRILELNSDVIRAKDQAGNLILIVICGFLVTGVLVAALITRSLTSQLHKLRSTMETLADGKTDVDIPYLDHPHELGVIANTLRVFAENMEARKQNAALLIKHQAELESSNHRLAQTNKELETFAYVASHDLKSPLRGIAQLSSWIEEDLAEQEFTEVGKHTLMLRNRIERMERLLDDMLVFYRAGKTDGKLSTVDVRHMATELFEIQNTKPGLRLELGDTLPRFDTLSTPFEQVVRNLFSNAIKHHDKPEGVIRLDCDDSDENVYRFSVTDDGPGIPEKFQERVFGMFQTLKPRDELEGSGMGLALIKKIVENYGGSISVFSQGRGCRFTFSWPRVLKVN